LTGQTSCNPLSPIVGGGDPSTWSEFPATENVKLSQFDIQKIKNLLMDADTKHLLDLSRETAQANDYIIAEMRFRHPDGLSVLENYALIKGIMNSDVNGAEQGSLSLSVMTNGSLDEWILLRGEQNRIELKQIIDFTGIDGIVRFGNNSNQQIKHDSGGFEYRTTSGKIHDWLINAVSEMKLSPTKLDLSVGTAGKDIQFSNGSKIIWASNREIFNDTNGFKFKIDAGQQFEFNVGGAGFVEVRISSLGISLSDNDIILGTATGTKLGTLASQKLSFWGVTPVIQPAHIPDPTGGATVDAEARTAINSILAQLASTGLQDSS